MILVMIPYQQYINNILLLLLLLSLLYNSFRIHHYHFQPLFLYNCRSDCKTVIFFYQDPFTIYIDIYVYMLRSEENSRSAVMERGQID